MEKTIRELSEQTGINRFTFSQAARQGRLGNASRGVQESRGLVYLIDDEHPDYQRWLVEHEAHPRVKGKKIRKQ